MVFSREPVLIMVAVQAFLALALSFGADLSAEQQASIMAAAAAVLGLIVRARVSPVVRDGADPS